MNVDLEARTVARATPVAHNADAVLLAERLAEIVANLDAAAQLAAANGLSGLHLAIRSDMLAAQQVRLRLKKRGRK